jgi:hypothetical protein
MRRRVMGEQSQCFARREDMRVDVALGGVGKQRRGEFLTVGMRERCEKDREK